MCIPVIGMEGLWVRAQLQSHLSAYTRFRSAPLWTGVWEPVWTFCRAEGSKETGCSWRPARVHWHTKFHFSSGSVSTGLKKDVGLASWEKTPHSSRRVVWTAKLGFLTGRNLSLISPSVALVWALLFNVNLRRFFWLFWLWIEISF